MKKLNVKAVVIDLRHVSEETLASYEHIQIHAALAMTSPRTEALLAKYPVELDATSVQCYDDDAKVNMVNGKTELTASHKPEGKSVLIVNGKANIAADAGDTLREDHRQRESPLPGRTGGPCDREVHHQRQTGGLPG